MRKQILTNNQVLSAATVSTITSQNTRLMAIVRHYLDELEQKSKTNLDLLQQELQWH